MYSIDKTKKPKRLSLFLAKPDKTIIAKISDIDNKKQTIKFGELNDLSFSIPYTVSKKHKPIRNPLVDLIRERYLIKVALGDTIEWYMIKRKTKSSSEDDLMTIDCVSLGYELKFQKMIGYEATSYNCLQVLTDMLKGTNWKIGYINPEFNLNYRRFDVSSKTKLDFLYEIAEAFNGIVTFDTNERLVSIWKEEELSVYKGFLIKYGKYLESIEETIDSDEIYTRLEVKGNDDLTINGVNPTGQSYIDDFSYFLYPFLRDEYKNVIQSSDYMSDGLCNAILDYNLKVDKKKEEFITLLNDKKGKQQTLTEVNNNLDILNADLQIILDDIEVAKVSGLPTVDLNRQKDYKKKIIQQQQLIIDGIEFEIEGIDKKIDKLKSQLKLENNLTEKKIDELTKFIIVEEWSDDNYIDENDLYDAAFVKLKEINSPPINLSLGIINFFEIIEEQYNWDRMGIGDIIKIKHDRLDIMVEAKITEISFDYESASIFLTISNVKKPKTLYDQWLESIATIKKNNTDYNTRKPNWEKVVTNFNLRNDRLKEKPTKPNLKNNGKDIYHVENDNGSVNLTFSWSYPNYNITKNNADNIDGFILYLYSSSVNEPYEFGSKMASETKISITAEQRTYTFPSVPANRYYTFGIRAYRRVDEDINSEGILFSNIASPTYEANNPYQPKVTIDITGNVQGKVNGFTQTSSNTEPSNPEINDVWYDTNNNEQKMYTKDGWKIISVGLDLSGKIQEIEKNVVYKVEIISSNGNIFNGQFMTRLEAKVYRGAEDVTDNINAARFKWTRISNDPIEDNIWNQNHFGGTKFIDVTFADVGNRATFNCQILSE